MSVPLSIYELKRLYDWARRARPGSRNWMALATALVDSFPEIYTIVMQRGGRAAELQEYGHATWTATTDKLHPDKPGLRRYEQVPCLIVRKGEILLRQWNCEHLVWDTEDGDDFFCNPSDVSHWMLLPSLPHPLD